MMPRPAMCDRSSTKPTMAARKKAAKGTSVCDREKKLSFCVSSFGNTDDSRYITHTASNTETQIITPPTRGVLVSSEELWMLLNVSEVLASVRGDFFHILYL